MALRVAAILAALALGGQAQAWEPHVLGPGVPAVSRLFAAAGFPDPGIEFRCRASGVCSTTFDPDAYAATWGITSTLYVNLSTGNDTTGTGASGAPYKTIKKAIATAQAAPDTAIKVQVVTGGADVVFHRDEVQPATVAISGKRIYIAPDDTAKRLYVTTGQRALSWSLAAGQAATYQATRTNVVSVLDMTQKDAYGIPAAYTLKASIAEVEANPGSWWQNGTLVYVHTLAGAAPVEGTHVVTVQLAQFNGIELGASAELFLRNMAFLSRNGTSASVQNVAGDYTATKLVAWNCGFARANPLFYGGAGDNGLTVESIKVVQVYSSVAPYNTADGFNFHYTRADPGVGAIRTYYALVFNSDAFDNGIGSSTNNNNAFTSHEGAHFGCVGCRGWNTKGPIFGVVNACNTVIVGASGRQSVHGDTGDPAHAAFYFDAATPPAGVSAAAWIYGATGDDSIWDLSSDGSVPIRLHRFTGAKRPAATQADATEGRWW
jgi:hypothetical protein